MTRIIQAEARITAVDATGNTFQAIAQKVRGLNSAFKSIGNVANSGIGNANRAIGRLQNTINTVAPVAASGAAYEGMRGVRGIIHETVQATAARAHEAVRMDVSGMSDAEIVEAEQIWQQLSEKYRALSTTTIMHSLRNMRSIVGTYEEAAKLLDPILKLRVAAMGAHPERAAEMAEDFDQLVKGMEIKGVTMDPEKFKTYMQGMAKAINVFGDTLKPVQYYEMFKYGRQATQNLNEKFMLSTAPTLAQELGGMSAGRAMSSFYQAIVGGRIKEQSVKEMEKLGLINEDKVVKTKTGSIKGLLPGGVKGWELAAHDPYAWTNEVLLPALKEHGVTSKEEIQAVIGTMFQQATAAQMVGIFATQQARIMKDWNLVEHAKGLDAADIYQGKDPFIAMQGVTEQFMNLLAIAGGPMAEPAAKGLNALAGGIVALEEAATKHPVAAGAGLIAGVGALGAGSIAASVLALRGLFGLGKSLVSTGAAAVEDLSGSAAIKAMQEALPELASRAGPSFLGTVLGSVAGPLGMLLGSTTEANKGEPQWPVPPHFTTGDIRSAVEPATAKVEGSAELSVNVTVEPSDSFVSRIISAIRNEINVFGGGVGTAGSAGRSMPEAVPGP